MQKSKKGAGPKESGNITVDLGEAIDKRLRSALGESRKEAPAKMAGYRPGMFNGSYRPGGRPGFGRPALGGFRPPWQQNRESRFGSLGLGKLGIQTETKTWDLLTGMGIGVIGNRALLRVSGSLPMFPKNALLHNAVAFVVGVIPALVKQNSVTLGVAVPGAVFLAASMVDWAMNAIGIAQPSLGSALGAPRHGVDAALAARQRLAAIQSGVAPRAVAAPARQYAQVR